MSLIKGITTGLMGYSLKKECLGEGLMFREVETIMLDVNVADLNVNDTGAIQYIQNLISGQFASISGDINVKAFTVATDYFFPNDSIRASRFAVQIENRKPANLSYSNLSGYYSGIDQGFFNNYASNLNNFAEEYNYDKSDNGNLIASHTLSFNLISGTKSIASAIASGIFSTSDANAPVGNIGTLIGSFNLLDSNLVQEYYTESYDLLKNTYGFTKKVEYPPLGSDFAYLVKRNYIHSLELGQDGIINVTEKGTIKALNNFSQAQNELNSIKSLIIYQRCNTVYNSFNGLTTGSGLINYPIKNDFILNKPALLIEYNVGYTDNPELNISGYTVEKIIDVSIDDAKIVNLNHIYNFVTLKILTDTSIRESDNFAMVSVALAESSGIVENYYLSSPFYNALRPNISRIKNNISNPDRARNFTVSMDYSNEPIYNILIDGTIYNKLEYKITDSKPFDEINEYKIINRPQQTSVLDYAYQTEKGDKNILISAIYAPGNDVSILTNPPQFDLVFYPLYTFAVSQLINQFKDVQTLEFNYFLSDLKCSFNSNYEATLSMNITYTLKKYIN